MCGRRWGKSLVSQIIAIEDCLKGKSVAYVTPTFLLAKVFFQELIDILPKGSYKTNSSSLIIEFITGGQIRFFTGVRLDSFRGLKFHRVIIDEASFIPDLEKGWLNSIRPTLTDYQGSAIFLSTPKGKNYFYSLWMKGGDNDWESFKYSTYDNPHILKSEIDDASNSLPKAVFEQEYLANPMENAGNPFGIDFIHQNISPLSNNDPICYGIDLAKSSDYTAILGFDNNGYVCHFDRFQYDWASTKNKIRALKNVPKLIDATGVGDPIVEELQREDPLVEGFKFTSQSKQQLMEGLVSSIQQGQIKYPEGQIVDELGIFEYQYSSFGVKYGAPSGFHDDCVCALALANKIYLRAKTFGQYHLI